MRQLIIARKDLGMSSGKLAAQCCHASEAFLTSHLRDRANVTEVSDVTGRLDLRDFYQDSLRSQESDTSAEGEGNGRGDGAGRRQ